ncbi:MAG: aminopeptidase P N-terminal domain-containing protein [Ectothiorhodospiraceae bacterium]|nr:aminopeptidase P N-terminal domain-containing protein [Chromatiales bacterium]MCP5156769.1 aminopeptidase P N-terminal domain-containing protein [Ectothiorhodospiraceae bacterium]
MNPKEFARRRKRLMDVMGEQSIAIIPTAPVRQRNRDVEHTFRPDSDFYYLTGFPEPESVAALVPGREQGEFVLFCRERDPEMEQWNGARAGLEGACDTYQADDAFPISDLDDILPGLLENRATVYYAMGYYPEFDQRMIRWVNRVRQRARAGKSVPAEFVALDQIVHDMRLVKSPAEVRTMKQAMAITARAHERAMRACRPGKMEYEIEAELLYEFYRGGGRDCAYPPIVAGGANACVLHYVTNRDALKDGDLLLIDAGAELDCYAADITRTFPVNGKFTREQRAVYDIVLDAQEAAIDKVRPGNHWNEPHEAAVKVLTAGLAHLGLLKGRTRTLVSQEKYRKFYMHRTGHWLGMDVHDVGDYRIDGEWRVLEPGMVLTVEPGLYISPGDRKTPKRWQGIGIRIEDDVLVGKDGPVVLTDAPKAVDDIEAIVGSGS